jgi:peptide subunit release factor 1 (eRF1)
LVEPGVAVAVITEDAIRELAAFRGESAPVTTCYLDVDGRRLVRRQDYMKELDQLLQTARGHADGSESVAADLRRIEDYVKGGIDRSSTRGLAIFACSAHDLFRVVPLPVPVRNRLVVNNVPAVGPLESVVQGHGRFGVLLADRQRARMLVFELGQLTDHSELFEELPRDYDARGDREQGKYDRDQQHVDELATQHLRHAAHVAFEVYQRTSFGALTIGAPDNIARELESMLHPYLRERLCGHIGVSVTASTDDIRAAAEGLEATEKRAREAGLVDRLRAAVSTGQRAVAGLEPVLRALHERRVEHLLVSAGYRDAGWLCTACDALAAIGRTCPVCGTRGMASADDVVEEAIEQGLVQGVKVHLCEGNADLDVLGRIGALLRY